LVVIEDIKKYLTNPYTWWTFVLFGNYALGAKINCFVNMVFGGDPRITISLRTQRNENPISRFIHRIANQAFHKDGVIDRKWGDLALSEVGQIVITVWWLVAAPILVWVL